MTLEEKFSNINELNICWVGDGNNVCNSWIHSTKHYDFNLTISCQRTAFQAMNFLKNLNSIK